MSLAQITPFLINTVAGAATGYITNDYAVKMLFRKYGPFGGVLLATKEKFVARMADLVERDIINAKTLSGNLSNVETQNVLRIIIDDTTKKHLYNNAPNISLQLVAGIPKTINNFLDVYHKHSPNLIENLLTIFLEQTNFNDFLPIKQQDFLTDKLFNLLHNELKNSFATEKLVQNFYAQNQEKTLADFIPAEVFVHLTENLQQHINTKTTPTIMITDEILQEIFLTIDFANLWSEFIEQYKNKNLYELLGKDNLAKIWQDFIVQFSATLQSTEGQKLIINAIDNIFIALKGVEVSLFALLEEGLQAKLLKFLQEHLPTVIENIIIWFQENKAALEELINHAIDDVLNKQQNDIFGKAKKFLKDAMYENVAGKQELIAKMINAIKNDLDITTVSEEISDYILQYLQNTSISEIIIRLESNGVISKNDLLIVFNTLINSYAKNTDLKIIAPFLQSKLCEIFDFTHEQTWYQHFEKLCYKYIRNYSWQSDLLAQFFRLPEKKLSELSSVEQTKIFAQNFQTFLLGQLQKNKTVLSKNLATTIVKNSVGKNITNILPADFSSTSLIDSLVLGSTKYFTEFLHSPELGTVYTVLDKLNQNEKFGKLAPAVTIKLLQKNFDTLLTGNVSTAVQNNLSALPDQELQNIVENFMGKELGPINIIGAVMGAVAGAGCYTLGLGNLSPALWINSLSSAAIFGLIGYTTNVLAIKMIFRPYKKWQVQNITVPCTPGIIAKQKPRFAISMSEFIDESLLNKDKLQNYFQAKRSLMENSLYDLLARDNFKLFKDFTHSNLTRLSKQLLSLAESSLNSNKDLLSAELDIILHKQTLATQDFSTLQAFIRAQSSDIIKSVEQLATEKLHTALKTPQPLKDFITDDYKEKAVQNILHNQLQVLSKIISSPQELENLCKNYQPYFAKLIENPLKNIFSDENYVDFKQEMQSKMQKKLQSETTQQKLACLLDKKLFSELKKHKTVGELWGGNLIALLQNHSPALLNFITQRGLSILQAQRGDLKATISKKAEQEHSFLFHALDVGSTISAIVDNFLDDKVPEFIQEKEADLSEFVLTFINNDLHQSKSQDLGLIIPAKNLATVIAKLASNQNIHIFLDNTVAIILDSIFLRPVQDILKVTDIKNLADLYQRLAPALKISQNQLAQNILQQKAKLVQIISPLIIDALDTKLLSISLENLTAGIHRTNYEKICQSIFTYMEKSTYWQTILDDYLGACSKTLRQKNLSDLLDTTLLSQTIIISGKNLFHDKTTKKLLLEALSNSLEKIDFEQILATESKEYLAKLISKSFLDSLSTNFLELLLALNIKEISHAQIDAMSPEEIEKMFYSFAAPYFNKVEMYGGAAAIFGMALAPLLK